MPFNYQEYEQQCSTMTKLQLKKEIDRHSDTIAGAGAGTGLALLAGPITMGLSAIAVAGTAPAIINARKKRQIARKFYEAAGPSQVPQHSPFRSTSSSKRNLATTSSSSKQDALEEQLPAYTPGDRAPDVREKQTYVPVDDVAMELPPSYEDDVTMNHTAQVEPPTITISTDMHEAPNRSRSSSNSSYLNPRTPLSSNPVGPMDLLGIEPPESPAHAAKGKTSTNPFLAPEEKEV